MDGYGKIFLLILAIVLILFGTSGKAWDIIQILKNNPPAYGSGSSSNGTPASPNPTDKKNWVQEKDKAKSGNGGIMA